MSNIRSSNLLPIATMRAISLACLWPALRGCDALVPSPPLGRSVSLSGPPTLWRGNDASGSNCAMESSTALWARGRRIRRPRRRRPRHGVDAEQELVDCAFLERRLEYAFLDRADLDHQGLAKSIDAEYALEEAKRNLSFWEVLEREQQRSSDNLSEKSKDLSAWARAKRRMNYARGDTESKYVLMADRSYGEIDLLDQDHLANPPSLDDLNHRPSSFKERYWSTPLFRVGVVAFGYWVAFPVFLKVFYNFQTIAPDDFDIVVGQIAPNVGVLYATILALTLQVLYERFTRIQENVTMEAMLLSQVTRNLLSLFAKEPEWAVESCQMVANQFRIMLSRTRGVELLSIMKADVYANLLNIVDDYHYLHGCDEDFTPQEESVISMLRGEVGQLMETRALRLSDEASSLPPIHFLLITSLSFVSIVAYVTASFKVVDDLLHPPQEASLLFAGLLALYFLFFNFCKDLNGPFTGVYQIKRSNAVSHLMQTKWLIVSQLGDSVNFNVNYDNAAEEIGVEEEKSFMNNVKAFFSGEEPEDIARVEEATMQTLVEELESAVETVTEDSDICDSTLPMAASLDCTDDARTEKLHKLQDELARLKELNRQVTTGSVEIPTESSDPGGRLQQMEAELRRLKHLRQINHELTLGHFSHDAGGVANGSTHQTGQGISAARVALEQASGQKTLSEAISNQRDDELLLEQAQEKFDEEERRRAEEATYQAAAEEAKRRYSAVEAKMTSLTERSTGVSFDPKLDEGLFLVGVGVRKKAIINVYAVAAYSSPAAMEAMSHFPWGKQKQDAQMALRSAARAFDAFTPTTSFVLEMVFKADAATIAGALAEGVKPRYSGPAADVEELESLIIDGVKSKGGQATKGTVFRFDCTKGGVIVSVDGTVQGMAHHEGMGEAFVDVFLDDKAVSPQLVNSCLSTWCGSDLM